MAMIMITVIMIASVAMPFMVRLRAIMVVAMFVIVLAVALVLLVGARGGVRGGCVLLCFGGCGNVSSVLAFGVQVGEQRLRIGAKQPVHIYLHMSALLLTTQILFIECIAAPACC